MFRVRASMDYLVSLCKLRHNMLCVSVFSLQLPVTEIFVIIAANVLWICRK